MKLSFFQNCKCWNIQTAERESGGGEALAPISFSSLNLREEYASAFRTESYAEFWARVLDLAFLKGSVSPTSSSSGKIPSYQFFVEGILDPDEATVAGVLARAGRDGAQNHVGLLTGFFNETTHASLLCGRLLKDIDGVRLRWRPLKKVIYSDAMIEHLIDLSKSINPFSSQQDLREVRLGAAAILRRLELSRKKTRARLRLVSQLKRALGIFLITLTASASIVILVFALHPFIALVAVPTIVLLPRCPQIISTRQLEKKLARLDSAAKGLYILNRDLDTISRLVVRLDDEVEHMLGMMRFWSRRHDREGLRPTEEVVRQLRKNDANFNQQLDELEEHLFLCFMTINKARSLVVKEILVS